MDAITHAIEAWSAALAEKNPETFLYRGAQLRYAVERTLFFQLVNDPALQEYFDSIADGKTGILPTAAWSQVIAAFIGPPPHRPKRLIPRRSAAKIMRNRLGNLLRFGKQPFHQAKSTGGTDFLFLAIHPKFVGFMAPVAETLRPRAAFLAAQDMSLEAHLAEQHLPYVALRRGFSAISPPAPLLSHFPELCCLFDSTLPMLDALRPRAIVVPEGNSPVYEIVNRAAQLRDVPTICLQHGAPAYTNPGFRNWSFADVFVWGRQFVEPFARHNRNQHFTVTGTPALLPQRKASTMEGAVCRVGFFLQKGATVIPQAEWFSLLEFIGWMARAYPAIDVIIRDHPSQGPLSDEERRLMGDTSNLRFMSPAEHSLNEVLSICDVVVASASTTLLEAVQAGAIPFIFGTAYPQDFPDLVGAGAAILAPDGIAARTAFTQLATNAGLRNQLRQTGKDVAPSLFAAAGSEGVARIAAALEMMVSGRPAA